jgi:uncharacterized RDD family membrane protein YckC
MHAPSPPDPLEIEPPAPGLLRRFAAMFYDGLLLFSVLYFAAFAVLPFTGGKAVEPRNPFFTTYLFLVCFFYFAWPWIHGGQTLGMRAWRIRVQRRDGSPLTWRQAMLRFIVAIASWACLGIGFWWMLVDRDRMTWHDRYSETVLVILPRR